MAKLWFTARRYGWGWTPASLAGWLVVAASVVLIFAGVAVFIDQIQAGADIGLVSILFVVWNAVIVGAMTAIAFAKGERPRWRWGD